MPDHDNPIPVPPQDPSAEPLVIEAGALHAYRMFDVADEIDLQKAIDLSRQPATRLKLTREGSQYLELPNPPIAFLLGSRTVALKRGGLEASLIARVFDHGAVSILLRFQIPSGSTLGGLVPLVDDLFDDPEIDRLARAETDALCAMLAPSLKGAHRWDGSESYHVVFVERFAREVTGAEILARENLARLLVGEKGPKPLSEQERKDVTSHAYSYLADDLAVVDWNCAFVYEPSGSGDVPDLLEIASAQLLELRYYDDLLDREINRIYDEIARKRGRLIKLLRSDYAQLRRHAMVLMLEVGEFTERVENSLKIVGDFYLARVYQGAVHRSRISAWQESVDRKEAQLAQIYDLLKGEVDNGRMVLLEATIVVLILFEIVMALGKLLPL
jgi:hypothetical protein